MNEWTRRPSGLYVPDLDDLEAKARAATPGWRRQGTVEKYHVFIQHDHGIAPALGRVLLRMNEHFPYEADAAFVAACSPDVVLALVGRVRELELALRDMVARFAGDDDQGLKHASEAEIACARRARALLARSRSV